LGLIEKKIVSGGKLISASRFSVLLAALDQDENVAGGSGGNRGAEMMNPFFVPVTHIAPVINAIEGVALIGLATLLGVALTLVVENMGRRLR
jgi:hypothetical protein